MKITDLLATDLMIMDLQATNKTQAIEEMVDKLTQQHRLSDPQALKTDILNREAQTSTGLGDGIAMPHAKSSAVKQATVLFAKSKNGIDYAALDQQPVFLFFMIAMPEQASDTHLDTLAALSRLLLNPAFVATLKQSQTPEEVYTLFQEAEKKAQTSQENPPSEETDLPLIVAVTACPTGIAHTYMAADALKQAAKEMNVAIKVETNGSKGTQDRLTDQDIARAVGVIVAADKNVDMQRFHNKPLVNRPVSDGIRQPKALIERLLSNQAPIFHQTEQPTHAQAENANGTLGTRIYKDLMNGVSHMLPFVVGGGIVIALAFMIDQLLGVPTDQLDQLGSYHQLAAWFKQIGDASFAFMLPVLAGFIASSIADRLGLIVGFSAGALASAGGAGFLGALLGGFLAGYVIVFLKSLFRRLPSSLEGIQTILFYPVFGLLITGGCMLVLNVPMKSINDMLNQFLLGLDGGNAALLGALLASMMAIDLGGPVNKAAYVFGTASIASTLSQGGSVMMASVMAGGMVPPLAIFIATLLFKPQFTKEQQEAGLTNLVMGLSFITEGAIPFAASDPLRTIPSFVVGSALTGALVGGFGIRLLAPHGGIFVALLLNHPWLYLAFIAVGAFVSACILGILRQKTASTTE